MVRSSKRILRERAAALAAAQRPTPLWIKLLCPGLLCAWLVLHFESFLFVVGLICFIGLGGMLAERRARPRWRALAEARKGEGICQFARSFDRRSTDTVVIRAVYEELIHCVSGGEIPIRADDDLCSVYEIDGEDIDYAAIEVARLTNRPLENTDRNPFYGKVTTAGDLVRFFLLQPHTEIVSP